MGVVFAKTRKGQEEIQTRAGGLTPRVRRVLIFVDGKRTVDDLRAMLPTDDLQHTLGRLEEEGYVEMLPANAPPRPPLAAFRPLPVDCGDPLALQKARNFMANTLNAFVGSLGASSLLDRIEGSRSHADLRALFDEWYHAMVMSRDGRREAETLRARLLEVI